MGFSETWRCSFRVSIICPGFCRSANGTALRCGQRLSSEAGQLTYFESIPIALGLLRPSVGELRPVCLPALLIDGVSKLLLRFAPPLEDCRGVFGLTPSKLTCI